MPKTTFSGQPVSLNQGSLLIQEIDTIDFSVYVFFFFSEVLQHMSISNNRGTPKWMVKIMENPIQMDDLGGNPLFLETPI